MAPPKNTSNSVGAALASVLPQTNKSWWNVSYLLKLNLLLLIPLMSSSVAGYDGSLMNGLQALPSWQAKFGHPTGQLLGAVNAAQSAGSILMLPICGTLSDRIGRRKTLLIGGTLIIIASIIQSASVNISMFIISRVVVGAGAITLIQPSPMLISELCYPTHRGIYTAMFWTCYYLGAIIASWSTYGLQRSMPGSDWAWRGPSILQGGLPLLQLVFWFALPESPRWLIAQGRTEEAKDIITKFHTGGEAEHPLVTFEMAEITNALEIDAQAKKTTWGTLFRPENRKKILITALLGFYSQWVGNSVVSYYLTLVLDTVGVTDPNTQTLINGLLQLFNLCAAVCAGLLVDKLGRRTLWNWSGIGMLISFVIWTACSARFALSENPSSGLGYAVMIFIFIYFFHYDVAYTPLVLAYPTEILQYSLRSKGLSLELGILYCSLVILSFVNPIALDKIGWKYYIVFCCVLFVSVITNWFLLPETRGRSLEEISELFEKPGAVDATGEEGKVGSVEEIKDGAGVATHVDQVEETKS